MLETCVKNCGHRFHVLLAKKELLDELVKVLNPKVGCFVTDFLMSTLTSMKGQWTHVCIHLTMHLLNSYCSSVALLS